MPAMHDNVLTSMADALENYKQRMMRLIPFDLTHRECIELVAPSEHIEILTHAASYADIRASEEWIQLQCPAYADGEAGVQVVLYMRTHGQKTPPLRPRTPFWQVPKDAGPHSHAAGEKVIAWMTKRLEIGRRFGLARHVLRTLNAACDSGTQLRYMFPAVMHLTAGRNDERTVKWATKYGEYKACRHTPAVSPQLKRAIQDSSALLTSAVLLGDDVPEREWGEVQIDIWSLPPFKFDDNLVMRI